jgi:hypothetical protein
MLVDRTELSNAEVLMRLYNASRQQGLGFLDEGGRVRMILEEAEEILKGRNGNTRFDYLHGRVMKVDVGQSPLDARGYDRDNGSGAAEIALQEKR